jgi:hypothetical protein
MGKMSRWSAIDHGGGRRHLKFLNLV